MVKAKRLQKGDKVAIVSLSSGILGEELVKLNLDLGTKGLKEFGLEPVFMLNSLKGIGLKGIEYLANHLMIHNLGLTAYYGPAFITDLGEIAQDMLSCNKEHFLKYLKGNGELETIKPSPAWYEERTDFSLDALGTDRASHPDKKGFELLQGDNIFSGKLLGGCIESLGDILSGQRYADEAETCAKYNLSPIKLIGRAKYFTTLDLTSGYWQIPMSTNSKEKTAFISNHGLYQFNVMPFGLTNAPSSFQRLMDEVLHPILDRYVAVYLDGQIICSITLADLLQHLQHVFTLLQKYHLKVKLKKCSLVQSQLTYLGFKISGQGKQPDSEKLETIQNLTPCRKKA